jgi:acetylornithine deacetylase/succinyl-diaminopimelate desuccinylase-like protein
MFEDVEVNVLNTVEQSYRKYIRLLADFVAIDTTSAIRSSSEMMEGARFVSSILSEIGFRTEVKSYGGHPIVVGEIGEGPISILMYNHYDVQPADPLELWDSPPFELVEKNGKLFGRGVSDNKGNIIARLVAIDTLKPYLDKLGVKVKWVIEGEEEIGSPTFPRVVEDLRTWLKAGGGFWESASINRKGRLQIPLGFKGMLYIEIVVKGTCRDVHSGYSPIIPNPIWCLTYLLSSIKSCDGKVLVDWLYEDIDIYPEAVELLKEVDLEELNELKTMLCIDKFNKGLEGFEALKTLYLSPSINISGIYGGYIGRGSKTIIPSTAGAKIDIRLVPNQNPNKILEKFKQYVKSLGIENFEVILHGMYPAGYTKPNENIVTASVKAAEKIYKTKPQLIPLSSGSGPFYYIANYIGTPLTGAGIGYYDSRVHAPNENIRIEDFIKGVKHVILTIIDFIKLAKNTI